MARPASYPMHDGAEKRAVTLVKSLLDLDLVKPNFAEGDKFPNVDGFLELVRKDGTMEIPTAKLDVQIKTLEAGALKFQCPASLVSYAETVTTLPVLLICADSVNARAFWKHVHRGMREFKEGQDSFVVKFDPSVDAIDQRKVYLAQWQQLADERIASMAGHAVLKDEVRTKLGLDRLSPESVVLLQRFLDRVNSLLDGDLAGIKALDFPNIWKLGIAVDTIAEDRTSYHIFAVPYGAGSPLIVDHSGHSSEQIFAAMREMKPDPLGLSGYGTQKFHTSRWQQKAGGLDPDEAGTNLVLDLLKHRVKHHTLRLADKTVATEVLFQFIDDFGHTAGLSADNQYDVKLLSYGLKVYFPAWYQLALDKFIELYRDIVLQSGVFPAFESVAGMPRTARPTDAEVQLKIGVPLPKGVLIRPTEFDFRSVLDAVEILEAAGIHTISRLYGQRISRPTFIWDGFAPDEGERRLRLITTHAIQAYEDFINVNRLRLQKNRPEDTATIYRYVPATESDDSPRIEYVMVSPRGNFPALSVSADWNRQGHDVFIDGTPHSCVGYGSFSADFLFQRRPFLSTLYSWLERDVMATFDVRSWTANKGLT